MPLVRITLGAGKSPAYRRAVADGVHQALVDSLQVPADDRFQIITELAGDHLIFDRNYLGIQRSDDIVFIQVFLRQGRSPAMKQDFYRLVAANLTRDPGLAAGDIFVTLMENELADWSFGEGRAQYVENPPRLPAQPVTESRPWVPTAALAIGGLLFLGAAYALLAGDPQHLSAALAQVLPINDLAILAGFTA
jgi:hypothetical protein